MAARDGQVSEAAFVDVIRQGAAEGQRMDFGLPSRPQPSRVHARCCAGGYNHPWMVVKGVEAFKCHEQFTLERDRFPGRSTCLLKPC
jgi:hypothetical protein